MSSVFESDKELLLQAIELMVVDALVKANDFLDIASCIEDPSQYWKVSGAFYYILFHFYYCPDSQNAMLEMIQMQLDDTIIRTIETAPNKELKEARDLILRIRRRNLYQVSFCWSLLF